MRIERASLALGGAALAALAAIVASEDGDGDLVPFFVALVLAAGVAAWAVHKPFIGWRRRLARGIGLAWLGAAGWIGVLLLTWQVACGCSYPVPPPEATYLGLTATVYHLAGVYLGGVLVAVAAFSDRLSPASG